MSRLHAKLHTYVTITFKCVCIKLYPYIAKTYVYIYISYN